MLFVWQAAFDSFNKLYHDHFRVRYLCSILARLLCVLSPAVDFRFCLAVSTVDITEKKQNGGDSIAVVCIAERAPENAR